MMVDKTVLYSLLLELPAELVEGIRRQVWAEESPSTGFGKSSSSELRTGCCTF